MKRYRRVEEQQLMLSPEKEFNYSREGEVILIPKSGKVFLHWYSKHGNLATTYTLDSATVCSSPVRIINRSNELAIITLIEL